jgi:hypothetical protein
MEARPASMMMKENGVQFQISRIAAVTRARCGLVSQETWKLTPKSLDMTSLMGPLRYSIISAVYATTTGTVSIGRIKMM